MSDSEERPACFDVIHEMEREGKADAALKLLIDASGTRVLPPYDADTNHAWYVVGNIYFNREDFGRAIAAFRRAIEDWPEDIDAYLSLGNSYSEAGDPGAARDALLKAYVIAPGEPRITYNLGNAYFDLGDTRKAEFFYKSVAQANDPEVRELADRNLARLAEDGSAEP